jgi:L-fuconate dehydratase
MFDLVAVSGCSEGRVIEFVDHLHEHFVDPVVIEHGRYRAPEYAGFGATMKADSIRRFSFPDGPEWSAAGEGSS